MRSAAFFQNVSRYPTAQQREELASALRQLPGCEWCTSLTVYRHFMNRRRRVGPKPA